MRLSKLWQEIGITIILVILVGCSGFFKGEDNDDKSSKSRLAAFKKTTSPKKKPKDKGKPERAQPGKGKSKDKEKKDRGRPDRDYPHRDRERHYAEYEEEEDDNDWLDLGLDLSFIFTDRIRYLKYPYYHNDAIYQKNINGPGRLMAGTFQNYYLRIDHNLWAYHLDQEIKFSNGVSLEFACTKYIENVPEQRTNERMDWVKYYFNQLLAEDTNCIVKLGLGISNLSDVGGGPSFQGALKIFPGKPWGIDGSASYSLLEGGMDITDLEFKLGLFRRRTEYTLGYRSLINSQSDNLSGPFLGFTWWF